MSLKKKIVLSFLLSAFIIALLSAVLYLNFVDIKKETVFLEPADTIDPEKVVKLLGGNRSKASEALGISRTSLWKILKEG